MHSKKPERQIPTGHRFSNKKTTTVPEKTMNPRSCLRWEPKGRIFRTIGLRWVPTGKIFAFSTNKVDGTSFNGQKQQRIDITADALYNEKQENLRVWLLKFLISKKPVPECYIKTRVGITIPPLYSNAEDNSHKVVRLGINPMIQPEPEDLPKDNPKLEIAVLSDTYVFTMKMEILLEPASNKLLVGYGTVVDVFIPDRKSKAGKRFAFVRFIKVDNVDRLVGNLCTLWIGRMHLHANVAWFDRPPIHSSRPNISTRPAANGASSFASVLKELEDNKEDCFARKRICIKTKLEDNILEKFKIIVRGKNFVIRAKELFVWSPTFNDNKEVNDYSEDDSVNGAKEINGDISEANSGLESSIPFPPGFTPEREFQHVDAQEVQGMENSLSKRRSEGLSSRILEDAQPLNEHVSPSIDSKKRSLSTASVRYGALSRPFSRWEGHLYGLWAILMKLDAGGSFGVQCTMRRHLSDHRPILLREVVTDYGPSPFRVYHSWFSLQGFDLFKKLHDIKSSDARDYMQKAKIQWAIEGDENSNFFHGIINRKRANLAIKGVMVDGEWVDDPCRVKEEFRDPLAPYLFILIMESLHLSLSRAIEAGIFKGIKIGSSLNISHLFYADDAVFIGEWSIANLSGITHILHCFSLLSGLSINLKKSHLLGVGIRSEDVNAAALYFGCSTMKTPFKYLGVMVGGNSSTLQAWDDTIGKLKARLSNWKLKTLSVGGRLTLLKSVLGSTPIYNMSIYKVPKSVLQTMESIRRNFFNGVQCDERKIVWIKWAKVLASKKYGGLGVSSFYALNRALLFKWVWRFISRDNSLWCRLIMSMHGSSLYKLSPFRYSTWKSIIREVHMLKDRGVDLISHCHIRVGNGLRTQFWNEVWIGDTQLRVMFPRIYALEINKDCTVADKLQFSVTSSLRRSVRGGVESSQLALLQTYIEGTLLSNMEDRWVWDLNGEGVFRVKDVRILLDECFLPKAPTATRWVKYVPIKINVFAWKVFLDRLPTRSNLQHRGVLVSDLLCPLCSSAQEDSSHLFFSCRLATDIVRLVCRWWNLSWTPLGSYADWLNWFNSIRLSSKVKDLLEGVLYITWWSVWMFRNQLLFSSKAPRKDVIFDDIVSRSFTWCLSRCNCTFSWDSWLQHPYLISL
ncbi:RNA-directed DNA polymerase, eukaryota [Tanacetum coccineum]